jgi:tripartite ATP-independent transporter DctM subunit
MEWWEVLLIIFGGTTFLLALGVPVAFAFILVNMAGVLFLQGGGRAFHQMVLSMQSSVSSFTLAPIPLFVLMGEILWHSRLAFNALDALEKFLGRMPGRLSVLTVLAGTVFSSLSGSTMATTAMLGTILLPEMETRGYKRSMSIGPILASGGLAMMIPPSALAVILASLAGLSISRILVAAILPGILMALFYFSYIVIRCALQPELTPAYTVTRVSWAECWRGFFVHLLPLGLIVFLVTGLIVLGIATPTESAALGCLGSFALVAAFRRLTWEVVRKSLMGALSITAMMLAIMVGAIGFSQILAYSGASRGLLEFVIGLPVAPLLLIVAIQAVILALGTFMEQIAIMLITLPILMPIITALGFDPIWFGILMLINLQMALTTPPFGLLLFVLKGVAPPDTTMREIYLACLPFLICDAIVLAIILAFPETITWFQSIVFD